MAYTIIYDQHGNVTARWALNDDGEAVQVERQPDHPSYGEQNVILPGPRLVKPEDGQAYLEGLEFAFRNPYAHAVFYPDDP